MDFETLVPSLLGGGGSSYSEVANYAALPDPTTVSGEVWLVQASTGIWPVRRYAGLWKSNGTAWTWLGNYTWVGEEIGYTAGGGIIATTVSGAIAELDTEKATPADVTSAISAHAAAGDPHPGYLTPAEGNAAYDALGAASSAVTTHEGLSNPHPVYLTQAEGDALYQLISTFSETLDDRVAALVVAGTNMTITYSDGAGTLTFDATGGGGGGSPGGADTQIQFNDATAFGGDADLTWNKTTNALTLGGTNTGITLAGITAEPAAPSAGFLHQYVKSIGGRMLPKIKGPAGLDTALQPGLFQNRVILYVPSTGTTGTGSGTGLGPVWTSGGTVSHPTPATTAPAISNQMRRTRYANVVTTTNQTLGIKAAAADSLTFWRGNAAGLGGFFFAAKFIVELYPASTVRIFAGLTASSATYVVASDTVLNNTCGLWHDTTDPSTGLGAFNFVTRDGTTTTKQQINLTNAIAAGNSYDFFMFCAPNGGTISWRLEDIVNGVVYEGSTSTTLPVNTAFMGPQCAMSNGTANITVTTSAIGVCGVYTEADK